MESSKHGFSHWELALSDNLSKSLTMNWNEGNLYRSSGGKLRKTNPARQRQREYFARARARAAQKKEVVVKTPPKASPCQSSPALSYHSRSSRRSGSSGDRHSSTAIRAAKHAAQTERPRWDTPFLTVEEVLAKQEAIKRGEIVPKYIQEQQRELRERTLAYHRRRAPPPKPRLVSPWKFSKANEPEDDVWEVERRRQVEPWDRRKRKQDTRARQPGHDEVRIQVRSQDSRWGSSTTHGLHVSSNSRGIPVRDQPLLTTERSDS